MCIDCIARYSKPPKPTSQPQLQLRERRALPTQITQQIISNKLERNTHTQYLFNVEKGGKGDHGEHELTRPARRRRRNTEIIMQTRKKKYGFTNALRHYQAPDPESTSRKKKAQAEPYNARKAQDWGKEKKKRRGKTIRGSWNTKHLLCAPPPPEYALLACLLATLTHAHKNLSPSHSPSRPPSRTLSLLPALNLCLMPSFTDDPSPDPRTMLCYALQPCHEPRRETEYRRTGLSPPHRCRVPVG